MDFILSILRDPAFIQAVATIAATIFLLIYRKGENAVELATGIQIEDKHGRTLREAVKTAVIATLQDNPQAGIDVLREEAAKHLRLSVPDAMKELMPNLLERAGLPRAAGEFITDKVADPILTRFVERYRGEFFAGLLGKDNPVQAEEIFRATELAPGHLR